MNMDLKRRKKHDKNETNNIKKISLPGYSKKFNSINYYYIVGNTSTYATGEKRNRNAGS